MLDLSKYRKVLAENLIQPMTSYIEGWENGDYGAEHIQKCEELISDYLCALDAMSEPSDDAIMEQVKNLVLALNDLDDETDNSMIETSEREAI